jgi:[calcium/calmodulin-dependent protein kinase] kinase
VKEHSWTTEAGGNPMIATEDNLYYIGKQVEEPTPEELQKAIGTFKTVL